MNHALFVLTAIYLFARKPRQTSRVVTYELPLLVDGMMCQGLREQNGCRVYRVEKRQPTSDHATGGGGGDKLPGLCYTYFCLSI